MSGTEALPREWQRPRMRYALQRSPLVLATLAIGVGGTLLVVPHAIQGSLSTALMVTLTVAAIVAFTSGFLVLVRSAAIYRIRRLRDTNKAYLDELARLNLYNEQICEGLLEAHAYRTRRGEDGIQLVRRLLDGATMRAGVAFDPAILVYLVESDASRHRVLVCSGRTSFPIETGKSCSADRTLEEVAVSLGRFWRIVPLGISGASFSLVMLSERYPTRADCSFLEQLGLIINLAEPRLGAQAQPPQLHAI